MTSNKSSAFCRYNLTHFISTRKMNCKKAEDRQDESIVVRVSVDDKVHIKAEAAKRRVSMSTVVRTALMNECVIPKTPYEY